MSERQGKPCIRGCGDIVYFDKDSPTGHPSLDEWVRLEMKEGRRTDVAHNYTIIVKPESLQLEFAETLSEILQEYVRLKKQELGVVATTK